MVNLTKIYTRTGDDGRTRLADNSVVNKNSLIVKTLALVDSANAQIGMVLSFGKLGENGKEILSRIQNELFDLGADLATPIVDPEETKNLRITPKMVERLENHIDMYNLGLEPLRSFVMPGGSNTSSLLHVVRTKVREAELMAWSTCEERFLNDDAIKYLNRLSDLMFVMARFYNQEEMLWKPGGNEKI